MDELTPRAQWTLTQPRRGLFGFAVTFVIALIITVSCGIDSYLGLVSIWIMSMVPIQLVMTIGWGTKYPPSGSLPQPWRGLALTAFMFIVGTVFCYALLGFLAGNAPHPFPSNFVICCICLTVLATAAFDMWPFNKMSFPARGFLTLITVYIIIFFGIKLFNFSILSYPAGVNPSPIAPVPFYATGGPLAAFLHLVPQGPVAWESGLTFWLWVTFLTFAWVLLEFWPLNKSAKLMKQPTRGLIVFTVTAICAYVIYQFGVGVLQLEPLHLMYYGVCFAFGLLIILVLLQRWPGRLLKSPAGAFLNVGLAVVLAFLGYHAVTAICKWHFGALPYPNDIFARATFMLGLSFPLWVAYADFWEFWPLPPAVISANQSAA
jgi:hypothetical protein